MAMHQTRGRAPLRGVMLLLLAAALPVDAGARAEDPTLLHEDAQSTVRWHLQGGANAVAEDALFWDLAETFAADSGYDPDKEWFELYLKPGLSFEHRLQSGAAVYGKLSGVSSYTFGTDAFDASDTGETTLEEAFLAVHGELGDEGRYDVTIGARELKLGTGMLIANGASSGFDRGALKLGPRKAWERAVIGRAMRGEYSATLFYLDPNEVPSFDGFNELAGVDLRRDTEAGGFVGATYVHVLESETPYTKAAPGGLGVPSLIEDGRNDTSTLSAYGRTTGLLDTLEAWTFGVDFAYQWNDDIDLEAWAGRVQISRAFAELPWSPTLGYTYQTFSGDDPDTDDLERFDPLYYEGNPSAWSTGSKSSMTFVNSNVNAHTLSLALKPTPMQTLTLRYSLVRANELRSPIQFGQAARVDPVGSNGNVIAGVTDEDLSEDLFLEYSLVVDRHVYIGAGLAASFPGKGIRTVTPAHTPDWTGGYLNVVFDF